MAAFDREQGKLVVRAVYDGPPRAGKTTNLRELCRFFAVSRRGELYTPAEVDGRTLYFDWLQIECGFVAGRPLRCELVSVPGQQELALRRSRLLRTADVVVFVCESTPEEVRRARRGFDLLREYLARGGRESVPIVVQANKQDLPGALSPAAVCAALGADDARTLGARAASGEGVREAVVLAVRAASAQLQKLVTAHGTDGLSAEIVTPEALYREMREAEAGAAVSALSRASMPSGAAAVPPPSVAAPPRVPRASARPPAPPELPDMEVPVGCVWPAVTGRATLRAARVERGAYRDDLARSLADGAEARPVIYDTALWRLCTRPRLRYADADAGRAELRRQAQRWQQLGAMLAPGAALALQRADDDAWWLWSVTPLCTTLQAAMVRAAGRGDEGALADVLVRFAEAAVQCAALAQWHGLTLDLHPSRYGSRPDGGAGVYLDAFAEAPPLEADLAVALLQRAEQYARWPHAVAAFVAAAERAVRAALGQGLDADALERALAAAPADGPAARAARERLTRALDRAPRLREAR